MFDWLFKRTKTYKDLELRVLALEKKVDYLVSCKSSSPIRGSAYGPSYPSCGG